VPERGRLFVIEFLRDLKLALRILIKKPGFAAAAVLTLALGIGANTAIFSVVNAVLLHTLPYRDANRLAIIWEDASSYGFPEDTPAPGNFSEWKTRCESFVDIAAIRDWAVNLTGDGTPEKIVGPRVTANLFSVLGVEPLIGRMFRPEEDRPGSDRVVLLSYGLWIRRFGADPRITEKQVRLDGANYTVAGVMPRGFQFPDRDSELWLPMAFTPEEAANHDSHYLRVVGRLKPGVTLEQANASLASIMHGLAEKFPNTNAKVSAFAVPLRQQFAGKLRLALLILLGAVAFVLLIACANVANLLLARATSRRRELAVRMALGAGRARIVRQLLTESLLIAALGGALGLFLSTWVTAFLWRLIPAEFPPQEGSGLDLRVLLFTLGVSLATGLIFGSAPAWRLTKINVNDALKEGGRSGVGQANTRLRQILVGAEVALALILLTGAGLLLESFAKLRNVDLGFQPEHLLTMSTSLPHPKYDDFTKRTAFYDAVLERVGHLPGVVAAGYTTWVPLTNEGGANGIVIEGRPAPGPGEILIPNSRVVSPDYFRAIGTPLKRGRLFDDRDVLQAPPVAIVNETMARRIWPGEDAIGKRFARGHHNEKDLWITVVGVVGDAHQAGIDAPPRWEAYFPYRQQSFFQPSHLAVRTAGDPEKMADVIRQQVWAVDLEQPVAAVMSMQQRVDETLSPKKIQTGLLGGFAALALVLASLGIYAVLSFAVAQRTRELGLRMALGAQRGDVFRLVLSQGLRPTLIGIVVGMVGAYALHRVMAHLLFNVSATDPLTFAGVAVLLTLVATAACYVPARRATRVDPMIALRYE
jgi:predicted permease